MTRYFGHTSGGRAFWLACSLLLPTALAGPTAAQEPPGAGKIQVRPYVVGQAKPPLDSGQTVVTMSLDEALARAGERNLDIRSAELDPRIQSFALRSAEGAYSTTVTSAFNFTNQNRASTSQLDGGQQTNTRRHVFNFSVAKPIPWYGGEFTTDFNNTRSKTNNSFATLNPSYNSTVRLGYSQPLLSGMLMDNERAQVEQQEIQGRIAGLQTDGQVTNITFQVREAYWALRAAIEAIEIQRRNLALAEELLAENQLRVQLGRMTVVDIAQTEAQVATAEQALLNAEIQWRNLELAFKRLVVSGAGDPLLYQTIDPTDLPVPVEEVVDIQGAVQKALSERTDIREQREQREISEVSLDLAKSNRLPSMDFTASYELQGVGGNSFARPELGGEPELASRGGFGDGIDQIFDFDVPTWSFGVNFSYPVGYDPARAEKARAELQLEQTDLAIRRQELAIVTEVTNAGLTVRNTFLQVEAARRSREAAERSFQAELARLEVGVSTNFEVVSIQNQLTEARLAELQATIDHVNAASELERVQRVGAGGGGGGF